MFTQSLIRLALAPLLSAGFLHAQSGEEEKLKDNPTRTLRIIVAGKRPMPAFIQRGDKIVEVDPPLSLLPPTSFAFTNPSHAPRTKPGVPRKTAYSAWSNQLIRIQRYKGPNVLPLKLSRPLLEPAGAGQQVNCDLGKAINPLVLLHSDPGNSGWKAPQARVIDMAPDKVPARSVTLVNFSQTALRIYVTKKGVVVPPNKHITLRIPRSDKEAFRYKVEASDGKKLVTVSNSSYRINKDSRIIMLALSGTQTKRAPFPLPKLSIISDTL